MPTSRTLVPVRAALALLGLLTVAQAAPVPVSAEEQARYDQGFAAAQAATRTYQARLTQTMTLEGLDQPVVSKGELFFVAPDKLLLRFSQPAGESMRVVGSEMTVHKPGQPPRRRDLSASGSSNAASLLNFFGGDPRRWRRDFSVTMARDGDLLLVTLVPSRVPTAPRQGVEKIVTTLRLPAYAVERIEVAIHGENRIAFAFSGGQRNQSIDPALFADPTP